MARKDAYRQEYEAVGRELTVRDKKGSWNIHHVGRQNRDNAGMYTYNSFINFVPNPSARLRISQWGTSGDIYLRDSSTIDNMKATIKQRIGYVPDKSTLEAFWGYFSRLRMAYLEEDLYYTGQD